MMDNSWKNALSHSNKPLKMVIGTYQLEKYQRAAQATGRRIEIIAQPGDKWRLTGGGSYVLLDGKTGIEIHGKGDLSDFWEVVGL